MARTRLTCGQVCRQLAFGALAVLLSLLSFAAVLRLDCCVPRGDGKQGAVAHATLNARQPGLVVVVGLLAGESLDHENTTSTGMSESARKRLLDNLPSAEAVAVTDAEAEAEAPLMIIDAIDRSIPLPAEPAEKPTNPGASGVASTAAALPATGYTPVSALSERPALMQDIDTELGLAIPGRKMAPTEDVTGILLINEHGHVDRLLIESPGLPHYLEAMLVERFAAARFRPGKLAGKPVRSALRIAVQLQ